MGIKDRITMITWKRKVIGKHHHVESVQAKEYHKLLQVKSFKGLFTELFQKLLPSFWDEEGKPIYDSYYQTLLVQSRMDHKMFEYMTQSLTGKVIIEKLAIYFEILDQIRIIGAKLSLISYVGHVELRVLDK